MYFMFVIHYSIFNYNGNYDFVIVGSLRDQTSSFAFNISLYFKYLNFIFFKILILSTHA